jgi:hypothetical protein
MRYSDNDGGPTLSTSLFADTGLDPGRQSKPQDDELLSLCARFHAIDADLDRLVAIDDDLLVDQQIMTLHDQWSGALSRVIALPAHTIEGKLAKSTVLQTALAVALGSEPPGPAH